MQLLISDTNIIIDLDVCGLLEPMFDLPFSFGVPDILYLEELEEAHGNLPGFGLQVMQLNSQSVSRVSALTSANDLFALILAQQESCPLVTGDGALRSAAREEGVEVKGTIWIIEQMIMHEIIDHDAARKAFDVMKEKRRFLPWVQAYGMIEKLGKG